MKKIRIRSLELENFKGIGHGEYSFGDGVNTVCGRNGSGKSTIADAVSWVLLGTDKDGNVKFGLKTRGEDGREIADVVHEVRMVLDVDGETVELRRRLTDTQKGGGTANSYSYYVDGESQTAGDYGKAVAAICDAAVWAMCLSPERFVGQDWTAQRKMLTDMFGEPSEEEIAGGEERFGRLREWLKKKSIGSVLQHLGYQKKELKKKLDEIPVRLAELQSVLPKKEDWDGVEAELDGVKAETAGLEKKLHYAEAGHGAGVEYERLMKQMAFAAKRKSDMRTGAEGKVSAARRKREEDISAATRRAGEAEAAVEALKNKCDGMARLVAECEKRKGELEAAKQEGAALWKTVEARKWEWNDEDSYCPTCGQMLPLDRLEETKEESRKRFEAAVAVEKKKLLEKAAEVKNGIRDCEENAARYRNEQAAAAEQMEEAMKRKAEAEEEKIKIEAEKLPDVEEVLAGYPTYADVCRETEELQKQMDGIGKGGVDEKLQEELRKQIDGKAAKVKELEVRLSAKRQWETVTAQADSVKRERGALQGQMDDVEEMLDAAGEWQHRACKVLEARVNSGFRMVKWSMFRRQMDGTEKPWCECSVDGVPYGDLNTAAKTNAGLDIVEAIKAHYGVDLPCIVDNAETVQEPLYCGGQQIRLRVTEDERIRIEAEP